MRYIQIFGAVSENISSTFYLVWDLINAGADVKLKDNSRTTALIQVAEFNNLEALKTLLDALRQNRTVTAG